VRVLIDTNILVSAVLFPRGLARAALVDAVNDDRTIVRIASRKGNAVLLAEDDDDALQETAYLFRSPVNAQRLLDADAALRRGEGISVELDHA